jgi:hypothetical protein
MIHCETCKQPILTDGLQTAAGVFCDQHCLEKSPSRPSGDLVSLQIDQWVREIQNQKCSECNGDGPVDVHRSYTVWSAIFLTRWVTHQRLCCSRCGNTKRLEALIFSMALGWWGVPGGLIITPIQILRNLNGMIWSRSKRPSSALRKHVVNTVRQQVSREQMQSQRRLSA